MTRFYGLRPWDLDRMWPAEIAEYVSQYDDYQRAQAKAARKG